MSKLKHGFFTPKNIAVLGVLTAFVVLLQAGLGAVKVGTTSFSLVLIPVVLCSCILGPIAGGFLGLVFSLIVFLYGISGGDFFTYVMLNASPLATILIIFSKGILAGVVPGVLFNAIKPKNEKIAIVAAALSAPVVNTAIFVLLTLVFGNLYTSAFIAQGFIGDAKALTYFLFIGCAGVNFLVEFCVNLIATPVFFTVIKTIGKKTFDKTNTTSGDDNA